MGKEEKQGKSTLKGNLKGVLLGLVILAALVAWIYFGSRGESHWAQNTVDYMFMRGWDLATADHVTTVTMERPWRLWSHHVAGLSFVNRYEILQLPGNIRATKVATIRMDRYENLALYFCDCRSGKIAIMIEDVDPRTVNVRELDWQDAANPYGWPSLVSKNLQTYICFIDTDGIMSPHPKMSIQRALDGWPNLKERGGV